MQVDFDNMPDSELGGDFVEIDEPQVGLPEIEETYELVYERTE